MMDSGSLSPASMTAGPVDSLYDALGGRDGCHRLAVAFYDRVQKDPILLSVYSSSFECPTRTLAAFFTQFFGGPCEYNPYRWSLSLREAHQRFSIGERERKAWLDAMEKVLEDMPIEEPTRGALRWFFARSSAFLVNQPAGEVSVSSMEPPVEEIQLREIAQRWHELRALEEMIAALRQGQVDVVLTSLRSPLIQACFQRDRAAFLSFLALLSGSGQPALLDYARQELCIAPELVKLRYGSDCTLLHEVASQGSASMVELLLQLGADPNARDALERTPLYFVGNALPAPSGAVDVVRALVRGGAHVDAQEKLRRCTALHMAARRGNVQVAQALLDCEAGIEVRDKQGDTPLHRAIKCGKGEMVTFLLSRGADATASGKGGLAAWQVARGSAMKQLLAPYAPINARGE